jgi:hypothetical protein
VPPINLPLLRLDRLDSTPLHIEPRPLGVARLIGIRTPIRILIRILIGILIRIIEISAAPLALSLLGPLSHVERTRGSAVGVTAWSILERSFHPG